MFFGIVANPENSDKQSSFSSEIIPVKFQEKTISQSKLKPKSQKSKISDLKLTSEKGKIDNSRKLYNSEYSKISETPKKSKTADLIRNSKISKSSNSLESLSSEDSEKTIDLVGNSEIRNSLNSHYSIPKIIKKKSKKGTRGKNLRNNPLNNNSYHRRCPPRTRAQKGKLEYHNRVLSNFENSEDPNFKATWYPADLKCHVCNVKCNKHSQLEQHFSSNKHKISVWNCTPKYCAPCGIFWGFRTPQLWEAHISSKKHNNKVGNRVPSVYGFRN